MGSSVALAADGTTPQCTSGAFNMVVVNKNVSDCDNFTADCLYDTDTVIIPWGDEMCGNNAGELWLNSNASFSLRNVPMTYLFEYMAYVNGALQKQKLQFLYSAGTAYDNCAEVFRSEPGAQCVITKSGDPKHVTYTLTISKKS